ncbi:hypothetical protein [Vibrio barjaei]|uniref:hypothetical protein n=1 Tax=Vibrio barjaei TaxID=1676683 RepID=UPI002283C711|nr:hypothetical protein [Vibrio barjaei]MCY9872979.1 hypothetical protein [Vibrio barjaei]
MNFKVLLSLLFVVAPSAVNAKCESGGENCVRSVYSKEKESRLSRTNPGASLNDALPNGSAIQNNVDLSQYAKKTEVSAVRNDAYGWDVDLRSEFNRKINDLANDRSYQDWVRAYVLGILEEYGVSQPPPPPAKWRVLHNGFTDGSVAVPSQAQMIKVTAIPVRYLRNDTVQSRVCSWAKDSLDKGIHGSPVQFQLTKSEFATPKHYVHYSFDYSGGTYNFFGVTAGGGKVSTRYHAVYMKDIWVCYAAAITKVEAFY